MDINLDLYISSSSCLWGLTTFSSALLLGDILAVRSGAPYEIAISDSRVASSEAFSPDSFLSIVSILIPVMPTSWIWKHEDQENLKT